MLLIKYDSRHSNQPISVLFSWIFLEFFTSHSLIRRHMCCRFRDSTREQHSECSHFKFFSFMKQIFCLQKIITYLWIEWRKRNFFSYSNFRNIFMTKDYWKKNLRVLVLFLYSNAPCAAPLDQCGALQLFQWFNFL